MATYMSCLGNILWCIFGGIFLGLGWVFAGVMCCVTIIGIPFGIQCFKFAELSFFPFGRNIEYGGGPVSLIANIIWLIFCGIPLAIEAAIIGLIFCVTIIGIPFGLQCFKIAKLALMPFGAKII